MGSNSLEPASVLISDCQPRDLCHTRSNFLARQSPMECFFEAKQSCHNWAEVTVNEVSLRFLKFVHHLKLKPTVGVYLRAGHGWPTFSWRRKTTKWYTGTKPQRQSPGVASFALGVVLPLAAALELAVLFLGMSTP